MALPKPAFRRSASGKRENLQTAESPTEKEEFTLRAIGRSLIDAIERVAKR